MSRFSSGVAPVIAVDFDGTIVEAEEYGCFVETFRPIARTVERIKELKRAGCSLILWTCRSGVLLDHAKDILSRLEILNCFDAFNAPSPLQTFRSVSPKPYYDYIIDDNTHYDLEGAWCVMLEALTMDKWIVENGHVDLVLDLIRKSDGDITESGKGDGDDGR